jgi:hypothetical protein
MPRQPRKPAAGYVPQTAEEPLWVEGPAVPVEPATAPVETHQPRQERRSTEPTMEDRTWCAEVSERGFFRPATTRPVDLRKTGRWGQSWTNFKQSFES